MHAAAPAHARGAASGVGGSGPWQEHVQVGTFLADHGWDDYAVIEFRRALAADPMSALSARFWLRQVAERRKDYAEAAQQAKAVIEQVPEIVVGPRGRLPSPGEDSAPTQWWSLYHLHAYMDAARAGDEPRATAHLDELVRIEPSDSEVVLEAVPALKDRGRAAAARKLFDRGYAQVKRQLDADPDSPEMMNNLAWLCARSGERLEEAVRLSQKAIAADPVNYAYIDTAAEALFRTGDAAEAVRLETRALEFRPDDTFMREQLERFRAGVRR
jgi:tetratricopeptide (TPR) repeat protein